MTREEIDKLLEEAKKVENGSPHVPGGPRPFGGHMAWVDALLKSHRALAALVREQCAEIERLTTWRPMESAPRDGTMILVRWNEPSLHYRRDYQAAVVWWAGCWVMPGIGLLPPDGWLPLPPAPEVPR